MTEQNFDFDDSQLPEWKALNANWKRSQKKREIALSEVQRAWQLADSDLAGPAALLDKLKADKLRDQVVDGLAVVKSHGAQLDDCENLQKAAAFISQQLQFFKQVSPVDTALGYSFRAFQNSGAGTASQGETIESWRVFRDRVHRDTKLLMQLAAQAKAKLKKDGRLPTLSPVEWRNRSFSKLFALLETVEPKVAKRSALALDLWNIYFHDDYYMTEELVPSATSRISKK